MALCQPLDTGSQSMQRWKAHGLWPVAMAYVDLFRSRAGQLLPGPCAVLLLCRKAVIPEWISSQSCVAQEKLFLTYPTYAASQFFLLALFCLELEINQSFLNERYAIRLNLYATRGK